jgi:flagellar hook assembly protein FlgD
VELGQNAPNPFNPWTRIPYRSAGERVRITIHDGSGRRVRTLIDGTEPAGSHVAAWDGRDGEGRAMPSGLYTCRLEVPGQIRVRRMMLLR